MNYLSLVNDVCGRVNETPLTDSNFSNAVGFYTTAKEAINSSIRRINQQAYEWPMNHVTQTTTLVDGQTRYDYETNAKIIDMDSFRIRRNDTFGNETIKLRVVDYDDFLENKVDDEYNTSESIRNTPKYVFRTPDRKFGLSPTPDKAYTLDYEYYQLPLDLVSHDDETSLTDAFRHVIVDGAMYYVYFFRGDIETADRILSKFKDDVGYLRTIYINNDYEYVRDTRIDRGRYYNLDRVLRD